MSMSVVHQTYHCICMILAYGLRYRRLLHRNYSLTENIKTCLSKKKVQIAGFCTGPLLKLSRCNYVVIIPRRRYYNIHSHTGILLSMHIKELVLTDSSPFSLNR